MAILKKKNRIIISLFQRPIAVLPSSMAYACLALYDSDLGTKLIYSIFFSAVFFTLVNHSFICDLTKSLSISLIKWLSLQFLMPKRSPEVIN